MFILCSSRLPSLAFSRAHPKLVDMHWHSFSPTLLCMSGSLAEPHLLEGEGLVLFPIARIPAKPIRIQDISRHVNPPSRPTFWSWCAQLTVRERSTVLPCCTREKALQDEAFPCCSQILSQCRVMAEVRVTDSICRRPQYETQLRFMT